MSDPLTNLREKQTRRFSVIRAKRRNSEMANDLGASVSPWFVIGVVAHGLRRAAAA